MSFGSVYSASTVPTPSHRLDRISLPTSDDPTNQKPLDSPDSESSSTLSYSMTADSAEGSTESFFPPPSLNPIHMNGTANPRRESTTVEMSGNPPLREQRLASLYIPLENEVVNSWPFDRRASQMVINEPMSPDSEAPYSPSLIHPAFAFPVTPGPDQMGPPQFRSLVQPALNEKGLLPEAELRKVGIYAPNTEPTYFSKLTAKLDTPTSWLVLYFAFNLGLTLYNKFVLQGFPFAWTLTGVQMLSGSIGSRIALSRGYFVPATLTTKENLTMLAFSVLYTVNIAVSNLSLHLVTVPFHQVVRGMTPLFTIILSAMFFNKRHSLNTYRSLLPVVIGVVFATYGDYYFTLWGLFLTLLGTVLAAIKGLATNKIQVGRLKLHPLDVLYRMSPLAFAQCMFFGWWSGELNKVRIYAETDLTRSKAIAIAINGLIAYGLNVVSFTANKKSGALTMTVAANVKQVLTVVLAVVLFHIELNLTNVFGIFLTLIGGAWYAKVELTEKGALVQPSKIATPDLSSAPDGRIPAGPEQA